MGAYDYGDRYIRHVSEATSANLAVGGREESEVARFQMEVLKWAGIQRDDLVLELGCGTGRLLLELGPYLRSSGGYLGVDVVPELVDLTQRRLRDLALETRKFAAVRAKPPSYDPTRDLSFSPTFVCAFSVFTHMEAEDITLTLSRIVDRCAPKARALVTFLPLEHAFGRANFTEEMRLTTVERYRRVRNVSYTRDMAVAICEMAGWRVTNAQWGELETPFDNGVARTNQSWLLLSRETPAQGTRE